MLLSQFVEHVSWVHSWIVCQLFWNNFKSLSKGVDDQLCLSTDLSKVLSQVSWKFHLDGTTSSNYGIGLNGSSDNHNSIIKWSFSLINILICTTSKYDCAWFSGWAFCEKIVSFASELNFFELTADSEDIFSDSVCGCLDDTTSWLWNSVEVVTWDSTSAEKVSVGEVLGGQVSNWELWQNDLSTWCDDSVKFVVDEFPFGINDFLIVIGVIKSDFSVLFLWL